MNSTALQPELPTGFESIDRASLALLEPVFSGEEGWRDALSAGLANLADAAMRGPEHASLETLAELAVVLQSRLSAVEPGDRKEDESLRSMAGGWAADLLDLCAGRLRADQVAELASGDEGLRARLVELAATMQRLRAGAGEDPASRNPAAAEQGMRARDRAIHRDEEITAQPASGSPLIVARDELLMLIDELRSLAEPAAIGEELDAGDAMGELLDGVQRVSDAMRMLGLSALPALLQAVAMSVSKTASADRVGRSSASQRLQRALGATAEVLAADGERPHKLQQLADCAATGSEEPAADGQAASANEALAPSAASLLQPARAELEAMEVVNSRAATVHGEPDVADLSLAIPPDADRSVVASLLRELPTLSAQLGDAIAAIARSEPAAVERAQRIAHTLKGSANTVGVRGIATITHALEDLLLLLDAGEDRVLDSGLRSLLEDAADCVAEMCEAVAGDGPPPTQAPQVASRISAGIAQLLASMEQSARAPDLAQPPVSVPESDPGGSGIPMERRSGDRRRGPRRREDRHATPGLGEGAAAGQTAVARTTDPMRVPSAEAAGIGIDPGVLQARSVAEFTGASPAQHAEDLAPPGAVNPPADPSLPDAELRVPASLVQQMLDLVDQTAILLAQAGEQAAGIERSRGTMRMSGDQLQDLAGELERLVDLRGMAVNERSAGGTFDSLELEEYDDLHTVSRRIAEAGADGKLVEMQLGEHLGALRDSLARVERLQSDLRDCALRTRMAEFGVIGARLRRTVRQAARMAEREAHLEIEGEVTPVDAGMLSALADALAHLLRNAVDHGIESPQERINAGKPPAGVVRLSVRRDGASLMVQCEDDGAGIDEAAVLARARSLGWWDPEHPMEREHLLALVLAPGFSTRDQASQLSGRGIGLDLVRRIVDELRGRIDVDSEPGRGARFTIRVPLGMASLPVMLVRCGDAAVAVSVRGVERIVELPSSVGEDDLPQATDGANARPESAQPIEEPAVLELDGVRWPLLELEVALGLVRETRQPQQRSALLMHASDGAPLALTLPSPGAPRNVVVRPAPAFVPRVPGIDGVTVLGDGTVAAVVDLVTLLAEGGAGRLSHTAPPRARTTPAAPAAPRCLVADDSVSVRRTMELFVRDLGFEVEGVADGVDALQSVRRHRPDLVLVDLEMPRMNGIDFVRELRADPATAAVPVIMITSRYSERHRRMALEAGVDVFLTKPYTEDALASRIQACLKLRSESG